MCAIKLPQRVQFSLWKLFKDWHHVGEERVVGVLLKLEVLGKASLCNNIQSLSPEVNTQINLNANRQDQTIYGFMLAADEGEDWVSERVRW